MSTNATIGQIQKVLSDPEAKAWFEVELNGQSYKIQFGTFATWIDSQREVRIQKSTPFWEVLPPYTVDNAINTIKIQAGGKVSHEGKTITAPAKDLLFAAVGAGLSRFDAVVFNLSLTAFEKITGEESTNPSQPAYNNQTHVLLTYLFIDGTGAKSQAPANDHVQNTDLYLNHGGANQVSAEELRKLANDFASHNAQHENYIGYKATEADLPKPLTRDAFALVGEPISIWVYDVETNVWKKPAGEVKNTYQLTFDDFEPASPPLTLGGPKTGFAIIKPAEITSYSFRAKLDGAANYTTLADIAALEAWITANVTAAGTVWRLIIDVVFSSSFIGETSLNFIHS